MINAQKSSHQTRNSLDASQCYSQLEKRLGVMRAHELAAITKKPLSRVYMVARSNGVNISQPDDEVPPTGALRVISAFTGLRLLEHAREVRISDLIRITGANYLETESALSLHDLPKPITDSSTVSYEKALLILAELNKLSLKPRTNKPIPVIPPRPSSIMAESIRNKQTMKRASSQPLLSIKSLARELSESSTYILEIATRNGIPVSNERSLLSKDQAVLILKSVRQKSNSPAAKTSPSNQKIHNKSLQPKKSENPQTNQCPKEPVRATDSSSLDTSKPTQKSSGGTGSFSDDSHLGRKGAMTGQEVFLLPNATKGVLGSYLGGGGEGEVYALDDHAPLAIKVFSDTEQRKLKLSKLEAQLQIMHRVRSECIHWPKALVCNQLNEPIGYVMRRVNAGIPLSKLGHSMLWKEFFPDINRGLIARMLSRLILVVEDLHKNNIIIGDINMHNILVSSDLETIHLIDTDSMQITHQQSVYRCTVGSPGLTPNELQGMRFEDTDRTIESDIFGLAIVIFQVLMLGRHPYDAVGGTSQIENIKRGYFPYAKRGVRPGSDGAVPPGPSNLWFNLWSHLTFRLKSLFIDCFDEDKGAFHPNLRPPLSEWRFALDSFSYEVSLGRANGEMLPTSAKQSKLS